MAALSTRRNDLRLDIEQQTDTRALRILSADGEIAQQLAREPQELIGEDLRNLLPRNILEMIDSYLDYNAAEQDLAVVLGKVRKFGLLHKKGREIRFSLKILRDVGEMENPRFQLHLSRLKVLESLRQQLGLPEEKEADVIDSASGMPNRASFLRHLKLVNQAVEAGKVSACLGLIRVDQYNPLSHKYGQEAAAQLFKQLGQVVLANLREDDSFGYIEPNRIAVLLLETRQENAKIPLNRIRWMFAAQPVELKKDKISATVTASVCELQGKGDALERIEQCQRLLREADLNAGNTILEPATR